MIESLSQRINYSTLNNTVYLNQASLGLISDKSIKAMHQFLDETARHGNSKMTDNEEIEFLDSLRKNASRLFNCSPSQLAIMSSASEMLNQLPYLFMPKKGSKVILISSDFPALYRPWLAYSEKTRLNIHFVEDESNKNLTETIINNLDSDTSVVVISYVQYSTGSIVNINRLRKETEKLDIRLVVDVTQAAGALTIDFKAWNCDAVICRGYKWLGGHGGVVLSALSNDLIKKTPLTPGWMGAKNPFNISNDSLSLAIGAKRFTQSTMSYVSIKGLEVSIKDLLDLRIKDIENHSKNLHDILFRKLKNLSWFPFHFENQALSSSNILSIFHSKKDLKKAHKVLHKNNFICSLRNNRLRLSIAHYNNERDIDKFLDYLTKFQ